MDFSGYDLFRMLSSLKQFVRHSLPPFGKGNNQRSWSPYKLPDLRPPNSPDLSPTTKSVAFQQQVQSTKVQGMKDFHSCKKKQLTYRNRD